MQLKDEKAFKGFFILQKPEQCNLWIAKCQKTTHISVLIKGIKLEALLKTGATQKEIACIVHFHPSTISRELKRNVGSRGRGAGVYRTANAQRRTNLRHQEKPKKSDFHQTHERLDS